MILRDPVHGLIAFDGPEHAIVEALLDTAEVQRLRRIRQLGLSSLAYPGADHTRFAHALGAAHVMTRFLARLRQLHDALPFAQRVTSEHAREALAAALLHDLGHGPFSHLFEDALPEGPSHEEWTARILMDDDTEVHRVLASCDSALPARVAALVRGEHPLRYLATTVSGSFDVDRCDYLLRDAHATGVGYGSFDLDWLLRSLRLGLPESSAEAPPLAIDGAKGLPAIESFILARLFMFQQVYFHKATRASDWTLGRLLRRVRELVTDGTALPALPRALRLLVLGQASSVHDYLELDDGSLWTAIAEWRHATDTVLSDLARRLYYRRLPKTHELYEEDREPQRQAHLVAVAREIAQRRGFDPDVYVGIDSAMDLPFDDRGDALRVLFPGGKARLPGDVSFVLGRLRGQSFETRRLVFPGEIRAELLAALGG